MFGIRIGKVALYFTTCGIAVLEASVNLYGEYLTKESLEGFGDVKIQGKYEGRTESHEQQFFSCELGTADEGE